MKQELRSLTLSAAIQVVLPAFSSSLHTHTQGGGVGVGGVGRGGDREKHNKL